MVSNQKKLINLYYWYVYTPKHLYCQTKHNDSKATFLGVLFLQNTYRNSFWQWAIIFSLYFGLNQRSVVKLYLCLSETTFFFYLKHIQEQLLMDWTGIVDFVTNLKIHSRQNVIHKWWTCFCRFLHCNWHLNGPNVLGCRNFK